MTTLQMAFYMTQYTDIAKAFFTVRTWELGDHVNICLKTQEYQETVSRWPTGLREFPLN